MLTTPFVIFSVTYVLCVTTSSFEAYARLCQWPTTSPLVSHQGTWWSSPINHQYLALSVLTTPLMVFSVTCIICVTIPSFEAYARLHCVTLRHLVVKRIVSLLSWSEYVNYTIYGIWCHMRHMCHYTLFWGVGLITLMINNVTVSVTTGTWWSSALYHYYLEMSVLTTPFMIFGVTSIIFVTTPSFEVYVTLTTIHGVVFDLLL